jgi:hypothetical protein
VTGPGSGLAPVLLTRVVAHLPHVTRKRWQALSARPVVVRQEALDKRAESSRDDS